MAYASGLEYEDFWNATWPEALASVIGYLKRNEDRMIGVRKLSWFVVMPWIEKNARGTEADLFPVTPEEIEEWQAKQEGNDKLSVVEQLKRAREEMREEQRAVDFVKNKL